MSLFAILLFISLAVNCAALLICFPTRGRRLALFVLGIVAVSVLTAVYNAVLDEPLGLFRFIPRGLQYLPVLFLLRHGKASQMCFFTVSILTMTSLMSVYGGFIAGAVFAPGSARAEWAAFLIGLTLLILFFFFMLKWGKRLYQRLFLDVQLRLWAVYSLYPIAALYVINLLYLQEVESFPSPYVAGTAGVLLSVFLLIGFLLLYSAIVSTYRRAAVSFELELSQNIINSGREYYELLAGRIDELGILRHDYKHHLNIMDELIQKQHFAEADAYLRRAEEALEETASPRYSTNRVVDALLSRTALRCREEGIAFEAQLDLGSSEGRNNYELCTILGNLLENSLEGCATVSKSDERFIRLVVKPKGDQLAIQVENSFDGVVRLENGVLQSRKKDGGMGLRSVRIIIDRLGGDLLHNWSGRVFTVYVLLNL